MNAQNSTTSATPSAGLPAGLCPPRSGASLPNLIANDLAERGVESELAWKIAYTLERTHCRFARWSAVFGCSDMDTHETIQWLRSRHMW